MFLQHDLVLVFGGDNVHYNATIETNAGECPWIGVGPANGVYRVFVRGVRRDESIRWFPKLS